MKENRKFLHKGQVEMENHIAVDIGASSGRLLLGQLQDGRLRLRELHRFANRFYRRDGHDYWALDALLAEILVGLGKAKQNGVVRCTLGIDTWGVDYVLLDEAGERVHEVYAYRDARTDGAPDRLHRLISRTEVYRKTGIQEQPFNTLYQLFVHDPEERSRATAILLIPDYLYYRLSGVQQSEITNASTTQLLNLSTGSYDDDLLGLLGLNGRPFPPLTEPGTIIGPLLPQLREAGDLPECLLIAAPSHDTAAAVAGVPATGEGGWAYLSSGTWSLLGVERRDAITSDSARERNYTNERGVYGTIRLLKNIMGLWMLQEVQRTAASRRGFAEWVELAEQAIPFRSLVPCNDPRFLHPVDMAAEIQQACRDTGQPVPRTAGELARCVFDSLALTYADALRELEELTGESIRVLHLVGGGAHNSLLCQWTANLTGKPVQAGPAECTAIGNLAIQLIACGELPDLAEARRVIARSCELHTYHPAAVCGAEAEAALLRWTALTRSSQPAEKI
jgi:rhamnulokinase